ncbi:tyrosine-type recombinase/integrase [Thermus caldilimi]|uniref:tyrosine-type recombinase/integrase n=1 Tax=Thermus caldilimi TaxID=2483360 RepID=UPI00107607D5|nr:site-specific integrase [Thermus caldilimi]
MPRRPKGEGSVRYRKDLKAYEIRLTVAGKRKSVYLKGPRNRENDRRADLLRRKLALAYGLTPLEGSPPPLLDWLEAHTEALAAEGRRDNTVYNYVLYLRLVRLHLGNPRLDQVTPEALEALYRRLAAEGYSKSVIAHVRNFLHSAYERALRYGRTPHNPVDLAKLPRLPSREAGRELGEDELQRILQAAQGHRLFPVFYLAAALGLRRGEILGLTWDDLDLERGELRVRRALVPNHMTGKPTLGPTKTPGSQRTLPLPEEARQVLLAHRERLETEGLYHPQGLVFPSTTGTPLRPENLRRIWLDILQKAGVPRARLHDLRATFITRIIRQTGNPKLAAALAGHRSLTTALQHYAKVSQDDLKATLRSLKLLPSGNPEKEDKG